MQSIDEPSLMGSSGVPKRQISSSSSDIIANFTLAVYNIRAFTTFIFVGMLTVIGCDVHARPSILNTLTVGTSAVWCSINMEFQLFRWRRHPDELSICIPLTLEELRQNPYFKYNILKYRSSRMSRDRAV